MRGTLNIRSSRRAFGSIRVRDIRKGQLFVLGGSNRVGANNTEFVHKGGTVYAEVIHHRGLASNRREQVRITYEDLSSHELGIKSFPSNDFIDTGDVERVRIQVEYVRVGHLF